MVRWRYQAIDPARAPPTTTCHGSTRKRRQRRTTNRYKNQEATSTSHRVTSLRSGTSKRPPPGLADRPALAGGGGIERRRPETGELVVPRVGLIDPGAGGSFGRGPERLEVGHHRVDPVAELGALRLGADAMDDQHSDVGSELSHGGAARHARAERTTRAGCVLGPANSGANQPPPLGGPRPLPGRGRLVDAGRLALPGRPRRHRRLRRRRLAPQRSAPAVTHGWKAFFTPRITDLAAGGSGAGAR